MLFDYKMIHNTPSRQNMWLLNKSFDRPHYWKAYRILWLDLHKYNDTTENTSYLTDERKITFVHYLLLKSSKKLILSIIAGKPFFHDLIYDKVL